MEQSEIDGVLLTPLKKILHPKGDIFHGIKRTDPGFVQFGEAYFTTVKSGFTKGWNRHKRMTLNLVVALGVVRFVACDGREKSKTNGNFFVTEISPDNYNRLTVPPGVWLAFMGIGDGMNLILNIADMAHEPEEIERCNLRQIPYPWDVL